METDQFYTSEQRVRQGLSHRETKRRIEELAPGGNFIFSAVHNVLADVPPENIIAMWETLQEYRAYKKDGLGPNREQ